MVELPPEGTLAAIVVVAIVTFFVTKFSGAIWNFLTWPFVIVAKTIYWTIAPRNPLSISVATYRRALSRSHLSRIENPVGPHIDVPLDQAYAPLKLLSRIGNEPVDLFDYARDHDRLMVLGGPGSGKTTLMKGLILAIAKRRADATLNKLVPVFLMARQMAAQGQTVEQAIVASFAEHLFPGAEKFVDSALSQGRLLIVMDGLDEVGANRPQIIEKITAFCRMDEQRAQPNRVIVTCREQSYRTEDLRHVIPNTLRVEPFSNHHMRVFLRGWPTYRGRSALGLFIPIQADSVIREICRNPLLLTILAGLYLETEEFELPKSRKRFYDAAIDELLEGRPRRRSMKQSFATSGKIEILSRASLQRLESSENGKDPEEFDHALLLSHARRVFGPKVDFIKLEDELVTVNGIIKQAQSGKFTFAHRTFQEYFAAAQAVREKTPEEMIQIFQSYEEFGEVLNFYCGMLQNVPQLNLVIHSFVNDRDWVRSGESIANAVEIPDLNLIRATCDGLSQAVLSHGATQILDIRSFEILSALSQGNSPEFDYAKEEFSRAIDKIVGGDKELGMGVLTSALATNPELTMKVVPALLNHPSDDWRKTAVRMLKDIGTDEALDEIVGLLKRVASAERTEAGLVLAELIVSRNEDVQQRARLLPPRVDKAIWPLSRFFPANLALAIIDASEDAAPTANDAINFGIRAKKGLSRPGTPEGVFQKRWQRIGISIALLRTMHSVARGFYWLGIGAVLVHWPLSGTIGLWSYISNKTIIIQTSPMKVSTASDGIAYNLRNFADILSNRLKDIYPPNAEGIAILLPWNWSIEPILPVGYEDYFARLAVLGTPVGAYSEGFEKEDVDKLVKLFTDTADIQIVHDFQKSLADRERVIGPIENKKYVIAQVGVSFNIFILVFTFFQLAYIILVHKRHMNVVNFIGEKPLKNGEFNSKFTFRDMFPTIMVYAQVASGSFFITQSQIVGGSGKYYLLTAGLAFGALAILADLLRPVPETLRNATRALGVRI